MTDRTVTLISTLLELHQIQEPRELLPLLLRRMDPAYGHALAAAYVFDSRSADYRLELLASTGRGISPRAWEHELHAPLALPCATAAPALSRLAAADPVTLTGALATLLDGLWPAETATQVQRALQIRFAAVAPIRAAEGPGGLVVLLLKERWPVNVAAECAAHAAAAMGRLIERRGAAPADAGPYPRALVERAAAREISRCQRYGRPLSLAVLEQHEASRGPESRRILAAVAARVMRQPDTAGYLDGERVVVLLPETGASGATGFLRRLQAQAGPELVQVRGGCATYPDDGGGFDELVRVAVRRIEPLGAAQAGAVTGEGQADEGDVPSGAEGDGAATVRVRVAPLTEAEMRGWRLLLRRLPAVTAAESCGFDGFAGVFDVEAPSVTRLLSELQRLAGKMGAALTPTITGEVGLTLRAAETSSITPGEGRDAGGPAATTAASPAAPSPHRGPVTTRPHVRGRITGRGGRRAALALGAAALVAAGVLAFAAMRGRDGGAGAVQAGAAAPPAATATAPATPVQRRIVRDLNGGCLPEPGKGACDALRAGLWSGDMDTWRQWAALRGEAAPAPAQVQAGAIDMRLAAGDPQARASVARAAGRALPVIAGVQVREAGGVRELMGMEIANLGVAAADLSGVVVPGAPGRIAAGATLAAGQRCVIGPAAGEAACAFGVTGMMAVDVAAGDHLRLIAPDGRELDEFVMP